MAVGARWRGRCPTACSRGRGGWSAGCSRGVHRRETAPMATCPFCAVVDGDQPAGVVLDDEVVVAFLDHRPVFKGHVLVVPRVHVETLTDLPVDAVGPFFERV